MTNKQPTTLATVSEGRITFSDWQEKMQRLQNELNELQQSMENSYEQRRKKREEKAISDNANPVTGAGD